jgi:hypothetical protein
MFPTTNYSPADRDVASREQGLLKKLVKRLSKLKVSKAGRLGWCLRV